MTKPHTYQLFEDRTIMREALHGPDKDDVGRRCLPPQEQLEDTVDDEFSRAGIGVLYEELQIYMAVRFR
jgi:hypothetical protein